MAYGVFTKPEPHDVEIYFPYAGEEETDASIFSTIRSVENEVLRQVQRQDDDCSLVNDHDGWEVMARIVGEPTWTRFVVKAEPDIVYSAREESV